MNCFTFKVFHAFADSVKEDYRKMEYRSTYLLPEAEFYCLIKIADDHTYQQLPH